ncbi:hypothetical protein TWF281_010481 [Arthrobotrys megalospora]
MAAYSFLLSCILVLVAFQQLAVALPIPLPDPQGGSVELPKLCAIQGTSDLYGLGVRIGLYLHWLSTFILRHRRSWQRKSIVRATTNVVCGSLLISLLANFAYHTALPVDYLIVYYLTVVLFYSESYNIERVSPKENVHVPAIDKAKLWVENGPRDIPVPGRPPMEVTKSVGLRLRADFPLIFQNAIFVIQSIIGIWFWISGLKSLPHLPCIEQETAALFGTFPLRSHPWQYFAAFGAVASSIIFAGYLAYHIYCLESGYHRFPCATVVTFQVIQNHVAQLTDFQVYENLLRPVIIKLDTPFGGISWILGLAYECIHFSLVYFGGPLVTVISVEQMIASNGILMEPLFRSTSQILVLLSGVFTLMITGWDILAEKLRYEHGAKYLILRKG